MAKFKEYADVVDADLREIKSDVASVKQAVVALDKLITDFMLSPGNLSPADEAQMQLIVSAVKQLRADVIEIKTDAETLPTSS